MKFAMLLTALVFSGLANASQVATPVYLCYAGNGDYTVEVTVTKMTVVLPGVPSVPYYVARARVSQGASTVDSGPVQVESFFTAIGDREFYFKKNLGFSLTVFDWNGVSQSGRATSILAEVQFRDQQRSSVQSGFPKRWLQCR